MRLLIFGPNGSGKGTQSAFLVKNHNLTHVESGGIFRLNIKGGTELGKEALKYINDGKLVPDSVTIPMVMDRLAQDDCKSGFILDGFPRTPPQAQALIDGLADAGTPLTAVIVIDVARETAEARLLGRRACPNGHPNNTAIPAISPVEKDGVLVCWKCGEVVTARKDDIDKAAIDQRLDIYFSETEASIILVEKWANDQGVTFIKVDGEGAIDDIRQNIQSQIS